MTANLQPSPGPNGPGRPPANTPTVAWHRALDSALDDAKELALQLLKFADRYGLAILALVVSAVLGWTVADGVSDYTQRGWEIHVEQPTLGIDLHFHHWYYGIPLGLLALLLIERQAALSIFLFGLGTSLSTHSFANEGGIPSIFEGGETLRVPAEVYLPAVTLFATLYAVFIIRRQEWLARSREREELAMSYLCLSTDARQVLDRLNQWAGEHFRKKKVFRDRWTGTEYGLWQAIDPTARGEWQLHYTCSPFDAEHYLLVVKLQHIPLIGRKGTLDEWLEEIHQRLKPDARPVLHDDRVATIALPKGEVGGGRSA